MSKINEMLLKLKIFQYVISLYLNMVYYNIQLTEDTSILCTIIISRGKYHHKLLTMVLANSPDNFQQKINDLFQGLEFIHTYIDDLLILKRRLNRSCTEIGTNVI